MTATRADAPTGPSSQRHTLPAQWMIMTRVLLGTAVRGLLSTTVVVLVLLAAGALIARWRGWELVLTETDRTGIEVSAGQEGVTVVTSLFLLPVAVGVSAVVVAIVLAARTRVYVAAGATRRSIALGLLLAILAMTAYVLVVTAVVLLAVGRGTSGALDVLGADGAAGVGTMTLRAVGAVLLAQLGAVAVTALFLRWAWWVGVGILVLTFVVLPPVVGFLLPALGTLVETISGWWAWDLTVALVVAVVAWTVLRRVPVR